MTRLACSGQRARASRLDLGQRLLGHRRVVLELEAGQRAALVAHQPGEADERADVGAAGAQRRELGAEVEVAGLDADRHQPPVIGGKNATSRAPASGAARSRSSWSTATRTAAMSEKASA